MREISGVLVLVLASQTAACSLISLDDLQSGSGGGSASTSGGTESATSTGVGGAGGAGSVDLAVSIAPTACFARHKVTQTVLVKNESTVAASDVVLTLDPGKNNLLDLVGAGCDTQARTCTIGTMDGGGTVTVDVIVDVLTPGVGALDTSASVTSSDKDVDASDNVVSDTSACTLGVESVGGGQGFSCALLTDGTVRCWGRNDQGEIGDGTTSVTDITGDQPGEVTPALEPLDMDPNGPDRRVLELAVGKTQSCVILEGGVVKCWGDNDRGQLGQGFESNGIGDPSVVNPIDLVVPALTIATSYNFACAVGEDKKVRCWGENNTGQLGVGDLERRGDDPNELGASLPSVPLSGPARDVCGGDEFACALLENGAVECWGQATDGALGADLPSATVICDQPGEVAVAAKIPPARSIACGPEHVCAILESGGVRCWGENSGGQLGRENTVKIGASDNGSPMSVLGDINLGENLEPASIAAGGYTSCAVFTNGKAKCWGSNSAGGLGQGSTSTLGNSSGEMGNALLPIDLGVGIEVDSIAVSYTGLILSTGMLVTSHPANHTCAITSSRRLKCWGGNVTAQLGLGDTALRGDAPGEMGDVLPFVPILP